MDAHWLWVPEAPAERPPATQRLPASSAVRVGKVGERGVGRGRGRRGRERVGGGGGGGAIAGMQAGGRAEWAVSKVVDTVVYIKY